jgi:hypothetical protein
MATFFDVITVTCFAGLVLAFFQFTDRKTRTLLHFLGTAIALAIANQVGNSGATVLALLLILVSVGYAFLVVSNSRA